MMDSSSTRRTPSEFFALSQAMQAIGSVSSAAYYREKALSAARNLEPVVRTAAVPHECDCHNCAPTLFQRGYLDAREMRSSDAEYKGLVSFE